MVSALKEVLPRPPRNAEIVLVYPDVPLDRDITILLRVIYHNNTLRGALFTKRQEANEYLSAHQFNQVALSNKLVPDIESTDRDIYKVVGWQPTFCAKPNPVYLATWDGETFEVSGPRPE